MKHISEIEKEAKNLLTKDEFNELKKFFLIGPGSFVQQINKYFDTHDLKIKNSLPEGTTLRVRTKNGIDRIELKFINTDGSTPECHDDPTKEELEDLFENGNLPVVSKVKQELEDVDISGPFKYLGNVDTLRSEAIANNNYHASIFLDESNYPGGTTDYEIEIESDSYQRSQTVLDTILHQFVIPKRDTPRKIQRFHKVIGL